jgi:ADP-ribose pyrophosphatase
MDFFFYGTLCHPALLSLVLGRQVDCEPARLPGYLAFWAKDGVFPILQPADGSAEGILVRGMTAEDTARLDFYEAGFAFDTKDLALENGHVARVYIPQPGQWQPGSPWSLTDWQAQHGDLVVATAQDFMGLYGQTAPENVLRRYHLMLVRGASRLRAAKIASAELRRATGAVQIAQKRTPYAKFFALEEYDLRFERFDGEMSAEVGRAVFVSGDAVTVLPYDPVRDRVLLVEQFRAGPFARGDWYPWQLEAIAGRIDPHETPEEAARREAVEEAGLHLGNLLKVAEYYPSPGAVAEYLYSYVAICDLPDDSAGVFGVEDEAEDIRGHLISFDKLMDLVASGEESNGPMLLTAFWLQRERAALRHAAGVY